MNGLALSQELLDYIYGRDGALPPQAAPILRGTIAPAASIGGPRAASRGRGSSVSGPSMGGPQAGAFGGSQAAIDPGVGPNPPRPPRDIPGGYGGMKPSQLQATLTQRLARDLNITPEQAAGITGNLATETGNFKYQQELRPVVPGSRGGWGLAQWTGPRRREFEAWASKRGADPSDFETQYGFLKHELSGGTRNGWTGGGLKGLREAGSVEDAAMYVRKNFLRPGIPHDTSRIRYAGQSLKAYNDQFGGRQQGSDPTSAAPALRGTLGSEPASNMPPPEAVMMQAQAQRQQPPQPQVMQRQMAQPEGFATVMPPQQMTRPTSVQEMFQPVAMQPMQSGPQGGGFMNALTGGNDGDPFGLGLSEFSGGGGGFDLGGFF